MRTRILVAAVLALGMRCGVAARAEGDPPPILGESPEGLVRDDRSPESPRRTRNIRRDEPTRDEARRRERLDELDEARINSELLEMEVDADRQQLRKMIGILKETELLAIQGFSQGPVLRGNAPDEAGSTIERYKEKLAEVRVDFVLKSKALGRERRRVAELEGQLRISAASPPSTPTLSGLQWNDAGRLLDLLLKGIDTWRCASSPSETPVDPKSRDADRLLDLIRKGIDTLQGAPSPSPVDPELRDADRLLDLIRKGVDTLQDSSGPSPAPKPSPTPSPEPSPVDPSLKDADRVLELILKGVENWQRR